MNDEIARVRSLLWEKIREVQSQGIMVRNEIMSDAHGGERGLPSVVDGNPLCLLGVATADAGGCGWGGHRAAADALGISLTDTDRLEYGFEGWPREEFEKYVGESFELSGFGDLGKEIADQLMAEEAAARNE